MILHGGIECVIFDMDGVLWDSTSAHAEAYRVVLAHWQLEMPPYAEISGRRTNEVVQELVWAQRPDLARRDMIEAITAAKQAMARQLLQRRPPLAADCLDVLRDVSGRKRLALASSASAGTVQLFLNASGTRPFFQVIITGDDVATAKPNPAIYLHAAGLLACETRHIAVVEDAPSGIVAARSARIDYVIGMEGTVPAAELMRAGARLTISKLSELRQ